MNHQSNDSERSAFNTEAANNLHLGYIESRWEEVAAIAWKEYLAHRRRALLFTPSAEIGGEFDSI